MDSAAKTNRIGSAAAERPGPRHAIVHRTCGVILAALALTGCLEAGPRDPTTIGVIQQRENIGDGQWRFRLDTGEEVVIDTDEYERLDGSAGGQAVGDLLLVGRTATEDWYMGLFPSTMRPSGLLTEFDCFSIGVFATDTGDSILFDNGLRLPQAADFDPRSNFVDGRFEDPQDALCITDDGEVLF